MPDNKITAEVSLNGGVATAQIVLSEDREHTETVPLHPRYPAGAPEEFMALDAMRAALTTVEKESFPALYDLQRTSEEAQRAKELGLYQEPRQERTPREHVVVRGGGGGSGRQFSAAQRARYEAERELVRAVLDDANHITSADSLVMRGTISAQDIARQYSTLRGTTGAPARESTANHDNMTTAYRRDAFLDGFTQSVPARAVSPEPRPIVTDQRLVHGRHIIAPDGAYEVLKLRASFHIDHLHMPSRPSDAWISEYLAHKLAEDIAQLLVVEETSADSRFGSMSEFSAEIVMLKRR